MDKEIEDKFIVLLAKIKDETIKHDLLKMFFEISADMEEMELDKIKKKGCMPCVSNCNNNNICNDNETDVKVDI